MTVPVLDVRNLSRRFGNLVAVRGVNFQVRAGSVFGLLGPNGSGKSTLIRMLCGVLIPSGGSAQVLGFDVRRHPEEIKKRIGYVAQSSGLYAGLSCRENLTFYGQIYGHSTAEPLSARIDSVLRRSRLEPYAEQLAGTLSGGWKHRLALACSLVHEPDLLFLDEPTAGLDPVARRQIWDWLSELAGQGMTLFVSTHLMEEAERCTEVAYLYQGRLLACGKPAELKRLPQVSPPDTRRYDMRFPGSAERLSEFRRLDGVLDATLFGEMIHALVSDRLTEGNLSERLGIAANELQLRNAEPNLEDVFVALTRAVDIEHAASIAPSSDRLEPSGLQPASPSGTTSQLRRSNPGPRWGGLWPVVWKETLLTLRHRATVLFMLVVPLVQLLLFGHAVKTNLEHIPLVVYNLDGQPPSEELIEAFLNARKFVLYQRVWDDQSFHQAIQSGVAKVGLRIPPDYSARLTSDQPAQVQVLIDGSDSLVAVTALSTTDLLGLHRSLHLAEERPRLVPSLSPESPASPRMMLEIRSRVLYNPDMKSPNFFVPALVGIILHMVTILMTAFAIVRERETGTLEQLFATPVSRVALICGKLSPSAGLGFVETMIVLVTMVYVFAVPVHGDLLTLLGLIFLFLICSLGMGLLISTLATTQIGALQVVVAIMLPSVLLSGFIFPRAEMPLPIYVLTFAVPVTYIIEIMRGVILRGAGLWELWHPVACLTTVTALVLTLSIVRFRKTLG